MLFIWDLHIKVDKKNEILWKLNKLLEIVDENNIIFLWDYVYHFAYNPKVLWDFFDLVINYVRNWKKIYILAWNHDYIKWHFIFAEIEKLISLNNIQWLKIISTPKIEKIYNKKILFFPFYTRIAKEEEFISMDKQIKKLNHPFKELLLNLFIIAYQCWKQDDKNLKISWTINLDLVKFLLENPDIDLFVPHFYIANTVFVWQLAKFSFKNIAISEEIFKWEGTIISGHLHKPFKYKNYICVWSFWNTSSLEENDTKVVFVYPNKFYQVIINPYITFDVEEEKKIIIENIENKWDQIVKDTEKILWVELIKDKLNIKNIHLIIKCRKFINVKNVVDNSLLNKISDIKYRQLNMQNIGSIIDKLNFNKESLMYSFASWKELAKQYIEKKYANNKIEYFKILEELGLM